MQKIESWQPRYTRLLTGHAYSDDIFRDFVMTVDHELEINLDDYEVVCETADYDNYAVTMVSLDKRHCVIGMCEGYSREHAMFEIISW